MRRRAESTSETRTTSTASTTSTTSSRPRLAPLSIYSHVSTYRSLQLELQLYSPSLKVQEEVHRGPLAVFSEHDHVGGKVILDAACYHTGRLTISVEGVFTYWPSESGSNEPEASTSSTEPRKHVFLSSSTVISVSPTSEPSSPRSAFRDAFIRKRPSVSALGAQAGTADRSHPFTFYLPHSFRPGEEMPASFVASTEFVGVEYKVTANWEPSDEFEIPSHLEVPILVQPDSDFQSVDALSSTTESSWLEMPLKSERPMPYRCAVTLPTSVTFSRSSAVPFFVVFTTTPRSPSLAKEIAADATISVSLLRQITIVEQIPLPPTPPQTPSSDESDSSRGKLLKRVARNTQPRSVRQRVISESISENTVEVRDKPLPAIPMQKVFHDSRSLENIMSIGFPKRPRQQCDSGSKHPSLETQNSLPDGLYKDKIPLDKEMLPCIDWAGISVKYYLDISVLIGQDDLRARIPIRIL